jgi:two-component system chemotaxis sensor kinase CheA
MDNRQNSADQADLDFDMSQYRDLFIAESRERIQVLNEGLLVLESTLEEKQSFSTPKADRAALEQVLRAAHTLKSMSAAMGYDDLAHLAHAMEDLLDLLRHGVPAPATETMNLLFSSVDTCAALLADVSEDRPGRSDPTPVLARLDQFQAALAPLVMLTEEELFLATLNDAGHILRLIVELAPEADSPGQVARQVLDRLAGLGQLIQVIPGEDALQRGRFGGRFGVFLATQADPGDVARGLRDLAGVTAVRTERYSADLTAAVDGTPPTNDQRPTTADQRPTISIRPSSFVVRRMGDSGQRSVVGGRELRIDPRQLDELLNLVGELVINQGQLSQIQRQRRDPTFSLALDDHRRILADLQASVLHTRLVPVAEVFNRFPRMVRDLLHSQGKTARLVVEGGEIELDRAVLEAIADPLVHLLRNAVDHGIESPTEREQVEKPSQGMIRLTARSEADPSGRASGRSLVVIEVADDGRGIDRDQVLRTAIARGIVTPAEVRRLSDPEVLMLICRPGFSTARHITEVSGRGVGMDVVRHQIEALHGSLRVESWPGLGTTISLRLPPTLAIIQALLVGVGGETYAIPLVHVDHVVAVEPEMIQRLDGREVVALDRPMPLVRLAQLLDVPDANSTGMSRCVVVTGSACSSIE